MNFAPRLHPLPLVVLLLLASPAGLKAQTEKFESVVKQLRKIDTRQKGNPSGNVPPAAQKLLPQFKAGLRERIGRSLNTHYDAPVEEMRGLILSDLKKSGIEVLQGMESDGSETPEGDEFGYVYNVTVRQPEKHDDLLAVVTNLTIPCGSDASLSLYQRNGMSWQLILVSEANGYADITGARGSFQFGVSPPDAEGRWFVVTADVNPWCSSNWQQLRYKVLRPGEDAMHPQKLLEENTPVYLNADPPYRLTVDREGFQVREVAYQSLDASILTRLHVQKYGVRGDRVTRIPPLATAPEDFLDEWMDLKWEDADQWVAASADASKLQFWHGRLSKQAREEKVDTELDFVQPCPEAENESKWQIGLLLEGAEEHALPKDFPEELFFTVKQSQGAFYLEGVEKERPPGCPGNAMAAGSKEVAP